MGRDPGITVILPAHNSERYIGEAVESLEGQTFGDFEVLCIDSGSDGTGRILREAGAADGRIRVISDRNASYGHKLNTGIGRARGKYVAVLESDDRFRPDMLERLWQAAEENGADFVKADYARFADCGGRRIELPVHHYTEDMYGRPVDMTAGTDYWQGAANHIWTGLYRTEFLRGNHIRLHESPGASYQDTGFSILCNAYAERAYFLPDALYLYRVDNVGSSVRSNEKYMAVKHEQDWIRGQLADRGLLNGDAAAFLKSFKVNVYKWNIDRLDKEYREKFLLEIRDEIGREYLGDGDGDRAFYREHEEDIQYLLGNGDYDTEQGESGLQEAVEIFVKNEPSVVFECGGCGKEISRLHGMLKAGSLHGVFDVGSGEQTWRQAEPLLADPDIKCIVAGKTGRDSVIRRLKDMGIEEGRIVSVQADMPDSESILEMAVKAWRSTVN